MREIEPGCLAMVVDTLPCERRARIPGESVDGADFGMVVEVVALYALDGLCSCCVSVMPTWTDYGDPRGARCRPENLLRIDGDPQDVERESEVTA